MNVLQFLVYLLGFVGVVAVTLLPVRAVHVVRENLPVWLRTTCSKSLLAIVVGVAAVAVVCEGVLLVRIFHCLTQAFCGTKQLSGWMAFAAIGVWYLLFEAVGFLLLVIARRIEFRSNKGEGTFRLN